MTINHTENGKNNPMGSDATKLDGAVARVKGELSWRDAGEDRDFNDDDIRTILGEIDNFYKAIRDPASVRINILRGEIVLPSDFGETTQLKAEIERLKRREQAVITLLYTGCVFVGSEWEDYPDAEKGVWPKLCAYASNYGADAEPIPDDQFEVIADLVDEFGIQAVEAWVCHVRGIAKPAKGDLNDGGKAALQALKGGA